MWPTYTVNASIIEQNELKKKAVNNDINDTEPHWKSNTEMKSMLLSHTKNLFLHDWPRSQESNVPISHWHSSHTQTKDPWQSAQMIRPKHWIGRVVPSGRFTAPRVGEGAICRASQEPLTAQHLHPQKQEILSSIMDGGFNSCLFKRHLVSDFWLMNTPSLKTLARLHNLFTDRKNWQTMANVFYL